MRRLMLLITFLVVSAGALAYTSVRTSPDPTPKKAVVQVPPVVVAEMRRQFLLARIQKTSVEIKTFWSTPEGIKSGGGSGVIIARFGKVHFILTAEHLDLSKRSPIARTYVYLFNEKRFRARFIDSSPAADLMLMVFCADQEYPVMPLTPQDPIVGDYVLHFGPIRRVGVGMTDGILSDKGGSFREAKLWKTTAPIWPGSSGGGFFNNRGELIGIASLTRMSNKGTECGVLQRLSWQAGMVPLPEIRKFLDRFGF